MLEELRVGFLVTSTSVALITCEGSNGEGRQRSKHSSAFLQVLFGTRRVCAREAPWAQRRSAECWRRSSGRGRGLRPSNRPGYCEHHRSRFSLKGRLERVELGVPSLFECIVKTKKGHIEPPGLRVRVRFRPVLEEEMATQSSILAWRIPWTGSLAGYSAWGHKESDTAERTAHTAASVR